MNSHVLLSGSLQTVIDQIEEYLIPLVHTVVLLGRRVNLPVSSTVQFSSLEEYNTFVANTFIHNPLFSENNFVVFFCHSNNRAIFYIEREQLVLLHMQDTFTMIKVFLTLWLLGTLQIHKSLWLT